MLLCRCRGGERGGRDHHRSTGARGDRRGRGRRRPRAGSARGRGPGGGGSGRARAGRPGGGGVGQREGARAAVTAAGDVALLVVRLSDSRSEEHTSELQSQSNLVCRLLLEKKKRAQHTGATTTAE